MPFNDIADDDPLETYTELTMAISPMGLAYLHVLRSAPLPNIFEILRPLFHGVFAAAGGFTGEADYIVFGKLFTSNPDLPYRFARNLPLTDWDTSTFYTPGAKGYIDFKSYEPQETSAAHRD
jgi:N-ethylmaleimide reductase